MHRDSRFKLHAVSFLRCFNNSLLSPLFPLRIFLLSNYNVLYFLILSFASTYPSPDFSKNIYPTRFVRGACLLAKLLGDRAKVCQRYTLSGRYFKFRERDGAFHRSGRSVRVSKDTTSPNDIKLACRSSYRDGKVAGRAPRNAPSG